MADVDLFDEYTKIFDMGMYAFNNGDAEGAKIWLTEASRRALSLSEVETDEELKLKLADISKELNELIEMHLSDVNAGENSANAKKEKVVNKTSEIKPEVIINDTAEKPVKETIETSLIIEQKDVFDKGIEAFKAGDKALAESLLSDASKRAEFISKITSYEETRNEYEKIAGRTAGFVDKYILQSLQTMLNDAQKLMPTLASLGKEVANAVPEVQKSKPQISVQTIDGQAKTIKLAVSQKIEMNFS